MSGGHDRVALDVDPRGLVPGSGVCGSALALPFADGTFDVVGAFDVLEHCAPEERAVAELFRVLAPGGRLLGLGAGLPWAWTDHDVRAGHHRRYTRTRLVRALSSSAASTCCGPTYGFAGRLPVLRGRAAGPAGTRAARRGTAAAGAAAGAAGASTGC